MSNEDENRTIEEILIDIEDMLKTMRYFIINGFILIFIVTIIIVFK